MGTKSIMLDMDGVLVDSLGALLNCYEKDTGIKLSTSEIDNYDVEKATGIEGINKYWAKKEVYKNLDLTFDAKVLVSWLQQRGYFFEVQSFIESDETAIEKARILKDNGISNFKFFQIGEGKKEFHRFDYVIEDNPDVVSENYRQLYLLQAPYNGYLKENRRFKYIRRLSDLINLI